MKVKIQKTTAYAAGALLLAGGLAVATGVIHKPTRKTRPLGFSSFGTNQGISRAFDVNPIVPSFSYNLAGSKPLAKGPGGTEVIASADNTPILIVPQSEILNRWAISVGILRLEVGGLREPHWHPNCSEIGYIAGGIGVMTIFSGAPASFRQSFTLETGTVFFVPNGLFHHIENIGNQPMTVLAAWNNERPQTIGLSGFVGAAPKDIVERSMGMRGSNFFNGFNNNSGIDIVIGRKTQSAGPSVVSGISQQVPGMSDTGIVTTKIDQVSTQSPFKYPIEMAQPGAKTQAGMTIMADSPHFPALKGQGQACFSITLKAGGGREPHWHQHAGELHFVHFGNTRYFVQAPGGQSELANLGAGEFFYAPPGYSHMFENIGATDLHVVSFFTDDNPGDIGLTGGMSSYTNAVLGATFMKDPNLFNMMKRYDSDQAIVGSPGSVIRARQMGQQQGVPNQ